MNNSSEIKVCNNNCDDKFVLDILKETGALLEGHFLLSSGRHSERYCQCARLLQYPDKAELVLKKVSDKLKNIDFDIIVGPAMGGVVVAYELARQMGKPGIFSERTDGIMSLRRGFSIEKGQKVVISEDVITTGKSSMEVVELIQSMGGEVVAFACIVDRRGENVSLNYPVYSAVKLQIDSFAEDECPLCRANIPYIKPGSRNIK